MCRTASRLCVMKTFVIDTNVFIHRSDAMFSFHDSEVVVPLWVLEELDRLKTYSDERGRNARHAIRTIDEIARHGNLRDGVKMENGSVFRVSLSYAGADSENVPADLSLEKADNRIILTAYEMQRDGKTVFFVSKDINARVKATALGLKAVDYEKQKINIDKLYQGFTELDISGDQLAKLCDEGAIEWNERFPANHFVVFHQRSTGDTALARYDSEQRLLRYVDYRIPAVAGVRPLNHQQRMALEVLLDPDVQLVSLLGKAGTGKTLLAIAAGLKLTLEDRLFNRVLVSRPVIPLGKDIGYLPGAKNEKLGHWMQPLFDNLEYIMNVYRRQNVKSVDQLIANRSIELEALSYIRGRSLPEQFIVIDEAQNLSPHEIKTIVSRAGDRSKVVLTGDPYQIDSPYLDSSSNGLTVLVEAFKERSIHGHVTLTKSERSTLAELAATLL